MSRQAWRSTVRQLVRDFVLAAALFAAIVGFAMPTTEAARSDERPQLSDGGALPGLAAIASKLALAGAAMRSDMQSGLSVSTFAERSAAPGVSPERKMLTMLLLAALFVGMSMLTLGLTRRLSRRDILIPVEARRRRRGR